VVVLDVSIDLGLQNLLALVTKSNWRLADKFATLIKPNFGKDNRTIVVDYCLPALKALPTLKEVKYIATRDAFQEEHVSEAWLNRTYDSVLYQIALRSLYELFQADVASAIDSIVFNGWVNSVDKATGKEVNACVLSVQATKTEFMDINLAQVDAKSCFKKLKGVSAARLTAFQPVRPILQLNKEDKRFIPAHNVAEALDGSSNLAASDATVEFKDFRGQCGSTSAPRERRMQSC